MNRFCNTHQGSLNTFANSQGICCVGECSNSAAYNFNFISPFLDSNTGNYCEVHKRDGMELIRQTCEVEGKIFVF
jgi:hypothetical protein